MGKNNMMRKKAGGKMSKYKAKTGGVVAKKNGGKMSETEARKIAANVAIRHDRKNSGK